MISNSEFQQLHHKLVQTVVDFFREKGLPENAWALTFSMDDIESSVIHGSWHPGTDSSMEVWDENKECLFYNL